MYNPGQYLASHMIALYDAERQQRSELQNLIRSAYPVRARGYRRRQLLSTIRGFIQPARQRFVEDSNSHGTGGQLRADDPGSVRSVRGQAASLCSEPSA